MQKDESIVFSKHALDQMIDRGADREEVALAILEGEKLPAKKGRWTFKKNFSFENKWQNRYYTSKQVQPVVVLENEKWIVVTVYVFYFGGIDEN